MKNGALEVFIEGENKNKEGGEGKKGKKKEKVLPTNIYIDIYLNTKWEEETGMNILKNGIVKTKQEMAIVIASNIEIIFFILTP